MNPSETSLERLDMKGVVVHQLTRNTDARGDLMELFRAEWVYTAIPMQWNFTRNDSHVFRGMHVHPSHVDYLALLEGDMFLGLVDLRDDSGTQGSRTVLHIDARNPVLLLIPPGVLHGYYTRQGNSMVIGMTEGWSMSQEFGCRWDDPDLQLDWPPFTDPTLSDRDRKAISLDAMIRAYRTALNVGP